MNRSILIVICDFLLLSLLTFSTDLSKVAGERAKPAAKIDVATNQMDSGRDLAAVMRLALEDEQKRRELLLGDLARARETAGEREKQLKSFQEKLQSTEQHLQTTEQQRTSLQQQFAAAQTNIESLSQQVRASSTDATISKERLAAMEAELRKRAEEAAALQQRLAYLSQSNQNVLTENSGWPPG
jgi:septal ring factor EnvC (AmiA/AmiB activator)